MLNSLNLRKRMFLFIIGVNLIVLLAIFFIYLNFSRNLLIKETKSKAEAKVRNVSVELQGYLNEKAKAGWTFSKQPLIKQWLKENTKRKIKSNEDKTFELIMDHLKEVADKDPGIHSSFVASEKTQMYYDCIRREFPDNYYINQREWYQNVVELGKPTFDVDLDFVSHEIFVNYRCPIYDEDGKLLGAGGIDITMEKFTELVSSLSEVFATGQAFLLDRQGTFLYHPNKSYIL
ncbi:MAG: cache domain-containing protein, partial [bacterium]